jgi:hypothetical protein
MNKVIMKKYREDGEDWQETTLQDAINHLAGYWQEDKIESMLLDEGLTLWNPFAEYKAVLKDTTL